MATACTHLDQIRITSTDKLTYLNTPFLYTYDGFVTEEISSIQGEGETWRRLKVTFPDNVKSHSKEQISCFGADGLAPARLHSRHSWRCHRSEPRVGLP